jgi:hypothetical protein
MWFAINLDYSLKADPIIANNHYTLEGDKIKKLNAYYHDKEVLVKDE